MPDAFWADLLKYIAGGGLVVIADVLLRFRASRRDDRMTDAAVKQKATEVKRSEFEIWVQAINELQEENQRLQARIVALENVHREYERGVQILLGQVISNGDTPQWTPPGMSSLETQPPVNKARKRAGEFL